jgi:hypothetical protein
MVPWLDEVLRPGCSLTAAEAGDPLVVIRPAPPPDDLDVFTESIPCFALDQQVLSLRGRRHDGGTEVMCSRVTSSALVRAGEIAVSLWRAPPAGRFLALRVIRELLTTQAVAGGARVELHAAAIERDDRVVLLAGPKQAGKTTLLLHLVANSGAALVANDRALLSEDRGWSVLGMPTIASVRPDTIALLPHLFGHIPACADLGHLTCGELAGAREVHGPMPRPSPITLSPAQLAAAAGVPMSAGGRLVTIAVLSRSAEGGWRAQPLEGAAAVDALAAVVYGARSLGAPTIFAEHLGLRRPDRVDAVLRRLAADIRVVDLEVGADVVRRPDSAPELVDVLLGDS